MKCKVYASERFQRILLEKDGCYYPFSYLPELLAFTNIQWARAVQGTYAKVDKQAYIDQVLRSDDIEVLFEMSDDE